MTAAPKTPAVMSRRVEPQDSLDFFPTPPWATRALLEHLKQIGMISPEMVAADPCAGRGHMAGPLREYFNDVRCSDIRDYGCGYKIRNFLSCEFPESSRLADWYFMNPPFRQGLEFILKAITLSAFGVAALVRTNFIEGGDRYRKLFQEKPPTGILQFSSRVIMSKGICRDPDRPYWHTDPETGQGVGWRKPSTATAYCWMFWFHGHHRLPVEWVAPDARKRLTRSGDYDPHEQPPAGQGA